MCVSSFLPSVRKILPIVKIWGSLPNEIPTQSVKINEKSEGSLHFKLGIRNKS
jgi:hypothetical protein